MKIPYKKMSGAGNDFIVVDNRTRLIVSLPAAARAACDRTNGIGGADGFIAIEPSERAQFEMKYFNADGSTGAMCGNGGRCAARFALLTAIAPSTHVRFEAVGSVYVADVAGERVRLAMPAPRTIRLNRSITLRNVSVNCHYINVETPHAVIFIQDMPAQAGGSLDSLDVAAWGKEVRFHPAFAPDGANANFAAAQPDGTIQLRTFERGVEAETLACGTGAVATALAAHLLLGIQPPLRIRTKSGEILTVEFTEQNGNFGNLTLEGSANLIAEGFVYIP